MNGQRHIRIKGENPRSGNFKGFSGLDNQRFGASAIKIGTEWIEVSILPARPACRPKRLFSNINYGQLS